MARVMHSISDVLIDNVDVQFARKINEIHEVCRTVIEERLCEENKKKENINSKTTMAAEYGYRVTVYSTTIEGPVGIGN